MTTDPRELWQAIKNWSEFTFGSAEKRGPIGALRHLKQEVDEIIEDPTNIEEYADAQILLWDAAWRQGFAFRQLMWAVMVKHLRNQTRTWRLDPDDTFQHVEENGE